MRFLSEDYPAKAEQQRLLAGSHIIGAAGAGFDYWQQRRRFIAKAIGSTGSFLDIGCANGLLLRSLLEWSVWPVLPYGIDNDPVAIAACQELFPAQHQHFATLSIAHLDRLAEHGLPASYDFVYWNLWDELDLHSHQYDKYPHCAWNATKIGGRLIIGFYGPDLASIDERIVLLEGHFGSISKCIDNTIDDAVTGECLVYWDKQPDAPHESQHSLHTAQGMAL
jgi:SAM-dependent methyltransferase